MEDARRIGIHGLGVGNGTMSRLGSAMASEDWVRAAQVLRAALDTMEEGPGVEDKRILRMRFRILRWSFRAQDWDGCLEQCARIYESLLRLELRSDGILVWIGLVRAVAQLEKGWGDRFRRSLADVLRHLRHMGRKAGRAVTRAAREILEAYRAARQADCVPPVRFAGGADLGPRGWPALLGQSSLGGVMDGPAPMAVRSCTVSLQLSELPSAQASDQAPGLASDLPSNRPLGGTGQALGIGEGLDVELEAARSWITRLEGLARDRRSDGQLSETDPLLSISPHALVRASHLVVRTVGDLCDEERTSAFAVFELLAGRSRSAWARAAALVAFAELSLWQVGLGRRSPSRSFARVRSDLGLAAGIYHRLRLECLASMAAERADSLSRSGGSATGNSSVGCGLTEGVANGATADGTSGSGGSYHERSSHERTSHERASRGSASRILAAPGSAGNGIVSGGLVPTGRDFAGTWAEELTPDRSTSEGSAIGRATPSASVHPGAFPPAAVTSPRSIAEVRRRAAALGFLTRDRATLEEIARLMLLAQSPLPILIHGESGTGKEVLAHAVHLSSGLQGGFMAIHCGAIPRDLVESELFGHARGAFTGASGEKPGLIEQANHGTLFLDEIGEMSPEAQMKMLRVLENGEVQRVGDVRKRRVQVRIVAATHRDLPALIESGGFREDLYHRIRSVVIRIPALRSRRTDIPLLAREFLRSVDPNLGLDEDAFSAILEHHWPGNVRELRSSLLHAAYLGKALERKQLGIDLLGLQATGLTAERCEGSRGGARAGLPDVRTGPLEGLAPEGSLDGHVASTRLGHGSRSGCNFGGDFGRDCGGDSGRNSGGDSGRNSGGDSGSDSGGDRGRAFAGDGAPGSESVPARRPSLFQGIDGLEAEEMDPVPPVADAGLGGVLDTVERRLIVRSLEENDWNKTRAAKSLGGISRTTLISKMKRLGIDPPRPKRAPSSRRSSSLASAG